MAIIKCPECEREVSDEAYKCVHCGKLLKKPNRSMFGKICLWLFYGYNILMVLWMISGLKVSSSIQTTNAAEQAGAVIGTGIGLTFILMVWCFGTIIIGILAFITRAK